MKATERSTRPAKAEASYMDGAPERRLYALALGALRTGGRVTMRAGVCMALNLDEAHGLAMKLAVRAFPDQEGFCNHFVAASLITVGDPEIPLSDHMLLRV